EEAPGAARLAGQAHRGTGRARGHAGSNRQGRYRHYVPRRLGDRHLRRRQTEDALGRRGEDHVGIRPTVLRRLLRRPQQAQGFHRPRAVREDGLLNDEKPPPSTKPGGGINVRTRSLPRIRRGTSESRGWLTGRTTGRTRPE